MRKVEVRRRGLLKQKWAARFVADNNLSLTRTTEHYHNLGDLKAMLAKYFPDWTVTVVGRTKDDK